MTREQLKAKARRLRQTKSRKEVAEILGVSVYTVDDWLRPEASMQRKRDQRRERYQTDPEYRQKKLEYHRRWVEKNAAAFAARLKQDRRGVPPATV